jgi:hypothetical protein
MIQMISTLFALPTSSVIQELCCYEIRYDTTSVEATKKTLTNNQKQHHKQNYNMQKLPDIERTRTRLARLTQTVKKYEPPKTGQNKEVGTNTYTLRNINIYI